MRFRAPRSTPLAALLLSTVASAAPPKILLEPVADNIIHVRVLPAGQEEAPKKHHSACVDAPRATIPAAAMRVRADATDSAVRFIDAATGTTLLTQTTAAFSPANINGSEFLAADVAWESGRDDALFGLGTYQDGHLDIRGHTLACHQKNLEDTVPLWFSSAGFGIFWDNAAPFTFNATANSRQFSLSSRSAGEIDYYLIAGRPDEVIAAYRRLTGTAPMFPKWAFGYHQSKERYKSQAEVLEIAETFRKSGFPLDLIIQDWQYWGGHGWNANCFDTDRFPDAKAMIAKLHAADIRYIVSVWPSFLEGPKGSAVYRELDQHKFLSDYRGFWQGMRYYDCFSPEARAIVWKHAKTGLLDVGVDGWWLDASEPELGGSGPGGGHQTVEDVFKFGSGCAAGRFPAVANAYPFFTVKAFHDGQRAADSSKRVFVLTRSVFAGSQRLGACYWTGDTKSTWDGLRAQIPACLGMSAAGIPYVNSDIGGFAAGPSAELAVRWFQFGAFCGEFRMHGTGAPREPWRYGKPGEEAYDTLLAFAKLRYRLLPYLYSCAWGVTSRHDTLMRPLVMDFPDDTRARTCPDEFLFGPSLLVAPVTAPLDGSGRTIPSDALCDTTRTPGGLSATYFKGMNFENQVLSRKDAEIRFAWEKKPRHGMGADPALDPIPALGDMNHFSVRWEGFIKTGAAGKYEFAVTGDDGFRLTLDGREIAADWNARPALTRTATVELPADSLVPVKLEYFQDQFDAKIELRWNPPAAGNGNTAPRRVVLPAGTDWYDFWTGAKLAGGQTRELRVPLSSLPLFVRAGSVLPFGPALQHTGESSAEPLELRVYPGADGSFTLYDDAGDGDGYERGERATITLQWHDKAQTLEIGARQGNYPGMPASRKFSVRLLRPDGSWRDKPVHYNGTAVSIPLQ